MKNIDEFVYNMVDTLEEYNHAQTVAESFPINSQEYIIGFLHDLVEDNYVTLEFLMHEFNLDDNEIEALYAITRQPSETYRAYIYRVKENSLAKRVKLADLNHNIERCKLNNNISLLRRYLKAYEILTN